MGFLGRAIITLALVGQAFLLYSDQSHITAFEKNLKSLQGLSVWNNESLPPIVKQYVFEALAQPLYFRLAVVGLLASSVLLFLSGCSYVAIFPFFGVLLQIFVTSNPLLEQSQQTQVNLLKNLAILGSVILWGNSYCKSCNTNSRKPKND